MTAKKFTEAGQTLILIHDGSWEDLDGKSLGSGDKVTFVGYCKTCQGVMVKECQVHLSEELLEIYRSKDGMTHIQHMPLDTVPIAKIMPAYARLLMAPGMNGHNGGVPLDVFVHEMRAFVETLGLREHFINHLTTK